MAADVKLCRDPAFATFALTAALRQLQACEASELGAAIATGTGECGLVCNASDGGDVPAPGL